MRKRKLVFGVGINDADYFVEKRDYRRDAEGKKYTHSIWRCPYYVVWAWDVD